MNLMKTLLPGLALVVSFTAAAKAHLVLQTDFGLKDGAVSAMRGVIFQVDDQLQVNDLSHEIPAFNIWEASYRLMQVVPYWKKGTVFVSVVDPGVGSARKSVVARLKSGHLVVTPDNGTLTHVAHHLGIEQLRQIDDKKLRLRGSEQSHTFHGRDLYAHVGAMLASGRLKFEQVGTLATDPHRALEFTAPTWAEGVLSGNVPVLDPQYGNVWTNIPSELAEKMRLATGELYRVQIFEDNHLIYSRVIPFHRTFGDVPVGNDLIYLNSLLNLSFAVNQGNFAKLRNVKSGAGWTVKVSRP